MLASGRHHENGKVDWTGAATDDATVMFDPSRGGRIMPAKGVEQTFGTDNTVDNVRYADDAGEGAQQSWADVKAQHGAERVIMIGVSQGNSEGTDVSAMLKSITFNGNRFDFNVLPVDGATGPAGEQGPKGEPGMIVTTPATPLGATRSRHAATRCALFTLRRSRA